MSFSVTSRRRAHPRSRGENETATAQGLLRDGSSPLTRGKPRAGDKLADAGRLIPAHAGKTDLKQPKMSRGTAHPRSRGENCGAPQTRSPNSGSSPLTRGKRVFRRELRRTNRLIPAHAGKTLVGGGDERVHWAHPRSRGENVQFGHAGLDDVGSSPLTRGKQAPSVRSLRTARLIPAHAGKTSDFR